MREKVLASLTVQATSKDTLVIARLRLGASITQSIKEFDQSSPAANNHITQSVKPCDRKEKAAEITRATLYNQKTL